MRIVCYSISDTGILRKKRNPRCHQNQLKFHDRNPVKNKTSEIDEKRGEDFVGSVYIPKAEKDHHIFYFFFHPLYSKTF